jgi:hypothetical protein
MNLRVSIKSNVPYALAAIEDNLPRTVDREMKLWVFELAAKLRKAAPRGATGLLQKEDTGIIAQKMGKSGNYAITAPYYLSFLEEGVSKHKVSLGAYKFDWWTRMKAENQSFKDKYGRTRISTPKQTAFLLRRRIKEKGTNAHPFTKNIIRNEIQKLPHRIGSKVNGMLQVRSGRYVKFGDR